MLVRELARLRTRVIPQSEKVAEAIRLEVWHTAVDACAVELCLEVGSGDDFERFAQRRVVVFPDKEDLVAFQVEHVDECTRPR